MTTSDENMPEFARAISFSEPWVFWCFISYVLLHLTEYIIWIRSYTYKHTSLVELAQPLDGRLIVMHVVIVLGTFLSIYTSEKLFPNHPRAASIGFGALFVLLKTGIDVFAYLRNHPRHKVITTLMQKKNRQ